MNTYEKMPASVAPEIKILKAFEYDVKRKVSIVLLDCLP